MKIEWSAADIKAGIIVGKPERQERWMIGYLAHATDEHRWCLVSQNDGMVTSIQSASLMAIYLTAEGEMPAILFDRKAPR